MPTLVCSKPRPNPLYLLCRARAMGASDVPTVLHATSDQEIKKALHSSGDPLSMQDQPNTKLSKDKLHQWYQAVNGNSETRNSFTLPRLDNTIPPKALDSIYKWKAGGDSSAKRASSNLEASPLTSENDGGTPQPSNNNTMPRQGEEVNGDYPPVVAFTIARIPARIAAGSVGQAFVTSARSAGRFRHSRTGFDSL